MLALTGGEANKPVSISRISGFPKMRQYKPLSRIKQALKLSTSLELTDAKHIRRRLPLAIPPNVEPANLEAEAAAAVQPGQSLVDPARPWLTKGMLKPTGFEEYFVDGPITPADYVHDRELYDTHKLFEERIEYAIQQYCSRRKFHSDIRHIFDAFMAYGGIDSRPRQFTGGLGAQDYDGMDASEIAASRATHFVAAHVEKQDSKWVVDFAGVARGVLCSETVNHATGNPRAAGKFVTVLSNFYRYLLHRDVCPEYQGQIMEALDVCRTASIELEAAMLVSWALPDKFAKAASIVSGGMFAQLVDSTLGEDGAVSSGTGLTRAAAEADLRAAFQQLGTAEQADEDLSSTSLVITSERDVRLQIMAIEPPAALENTPLTHGTRFGKMACRELEETFEGPLHDHHELLVFWIDQETLGKCFTGMKMDVTVCENSVGCRWIERVKSANPSYYHVIANDIYEKEDDAVLPKEWYKRERTILEQGYKIQRDDPDDQELMMDESHDNTTDEALHSV